MSVVLLACTASPEGEDSAVTVDMAVADSPVVDTGDTAEPGEPPPIVDLDLYGYAGPDFSRVSELASSGAAAVAIR